MPATHPIRSPRKPGLSVSVLLPAVAAWVMLAGIVSILLFLCLGCALPQPAATEVKGTGFSVKSPKDIDCDSFVVKRDLPGGGHEEIEIHGLRSNGSAVNKSMDAQVAAGIAANLEMFRAGVEAGKSLAPLGPRP